ncbi:hypothetical protein EVAR_94487_1 [Eumeta japonica]|uniref:Uncharacterized protein n=1 Tax=Eumeta variegata TaxID=151549 RepID=A0A4C1UV57_EUMVA|nr:hypothetical protein EVAR_94487_1 [Eumeta japonica]
MMGIRGTPHASSYLSGKAQHIEVGSEFEDILSMEIPPWIINPFDVTEVENMILQEELFELSTNEEGLMMELPNFQLHYHTLQVNHDQSVFHDNINKSKHG